MFVACIPSNVQDFVGKEKEHYYPEHHIPRVAKEYSAYRDLNVRIQKALPKTGTKRAWPFFTEQEEHEFLSSFDELLNSPISLHDFQDESEKIFIERKLSEFNWNISKTAEALNIQRSHLYTKIKQYNIENPNKVE